jgi:hypothetical protein
LGVIELRELGGVLEAQGSLVDEAPRLVGQGGHAAEQRDLLRLGTRAQAGFLVAETELEELLGRLQRAPAE